MFGPGAQNNGPGTQPIFQPGQQHASQTVGAPSPPGYHTPTGLSNYSANVSDSVLAPKKQAVSPIPLGAQPVSAFEVSGNQSGTPGQQPGPTQSGQSLFGVPNQTGTIPSFFSNPQNQAQTSAPIQLFGAPFTQQNQQTQLFGQQTQNPPPLIGASTTAPKPVNQLGGGFGFGQPLQPNLFPQQQLQQQQSQQQQQKHPHFLPNSIFAFQNLQVNGSTYAPTIHGYKDLCFAESKPKIAEYTFLYRVPNALEFALSSNNSLNQKKIGELQPEFIAAAKTIDDRFQANIKRINEFKAKIAEIDRRSHNLPKEPFRKALLKANELNFKINSFLGQFEVANQEFKKFEEIVHEHRSKVPLQSQYYMHPLQYPMPGLKMLSSSLTERLEDVCVKLNELVVYLNSVNQPEDNVRSKHDQILDILQDLSQFVAIVFARNTQIQQYLSHFKGTYLGTQPKSESFELEPIEEVSSTKKAEAILSKIINR